MSPAECTLQAINHRYLPTLAAQTDSLILSLAECPLRQFSHLVRSPSSAVPPMHRLRSCKFARLVSANVMRVLMLKLVGTVPGMSLDGRLRVYPTGRTRNLIGARQCTLLQALKQSVRARNSAQSSFILVILLTL